MKHFTIKKFLLFVLVTILVSTSVPTKTLAARITAAATDTIAVKDTAIIQVFLDTEGEKINVVDGSVTLTDEHGGDFQIKELSVAGSAFSLWPRSPSIDLNSKTISFVGGAPAGLSGSHLLLFKIIASFNQAGAVTVSPSHLTAYLNDGNATSRTITTTSSKITIAPAAADTNDAWKMVVAKDNIPPLPFTITVVQDPTANDGKKFITFNTTDADSGIDYYEVVEGSLPPVRSGTTYVLVNQDRADQITVIAYDVAGNFRTATLQKKHTTIWIVVGLIILIAIGFIFWRRRRISKRKTI